MASLQDDVNHEEEYQSLFECLDSVMLDRGWARSVQAVSMAITLEQNCSSVLMSRLQEEVTHRWPARMPMTLGRQSPPMTTARPM